MQLEKRKTIKLFSLPDDKKKRPEKQQKSTVLGTSSPLLNVYCGSSDANLSVSSSSINETFDVTSVMENSENRHVNQYISRRQLKFFRIF